MSLYFALDSALSGLNTAERALSITAHNIANANTEGYVRKVVNQQVRTIEGRGSGTELARLTRVVDEFLIAELRTRSGALARGDALDRYHEHGQSLFGAPGEGRDLATGFGRLSAALEAFANTPENTALAVGAVNAVEDVVREVGRVADGVQRLRGAADQEIARTVEEVNGELRAIDELNREIMRLNRLDHDSVELQDKRDKLLLGLSEKLDVSTYDLEDGGVAVATTGGVVLLDHSPRVLVYKPAATVTDSTTFGRLAAFAQRDIDPGTGLPKNAGAGVELVSSGVRAELTPELRADDVPDAQQTIATTLRSGRIKGLLEVRDRVLPELNDQVQELAANLRFALNAAHNRGTPQPPPSTLAGTRTDLSGFAAGSGAGEATLAVVDADGNTVTAFALDVSAPDAATLAERIDAGLGALGTASIADDGGLRISLADGAHGLAIDEGSSAIAVTDGAGRTRTYGFSHYFGLNDLVLPDGGGARASDLRVRPDIAADPGRLSTARLDVDAGPPLRASLGGAGDNRAAQGLAAAVTEAREFAARGGLPARSATLAEYAADVVAVTAIEADRAREALARERALVDDLSYRAAAVSGVNVDEELSRLVLYQQSYAVSARLISMTDSMFDQLIGTVRR